MGQAISKYHKQDHTTKQLLNVINEYYPNIYSSLSKKQMRNLSNKIICIECINLDDRYYKQWQRFNYNNRQMDISNKLINISESECTKPKEDTCKESYLIDTFNGKTKCHTCNHYHNKIPCNKIMKRSIINTTSNYDSQYIIKYCNCIQERFIYKTVN
jgi:hypothetical protein